jgi:hypothetical protein
MVRAPCQHTTANVLILPASLRVPPARARASVQSRRPLAQQRVRLAHTGLLLASLEHALLKHLLEYAHTRRALCEATGGKVQMGQLDAAARVVARQHPDMSAPSVSAAAHFAAQLCDELLRVTKGAGKTVAPGRDLLWTKAVCAAAEAAVRNGFGRDQPPLTLAAALTFFVFERHTPKTAPSTKQVSEAAGIKEEDLMSAYIVDVLPNMEVC